MMLAQKMPVTLVKGAQDAHYCRLYAGLEPENGSKPTKTDCPWHLSTLPRTALGKPFKYEQPARR
jgi:hypothetical protein